MIKLVCSIGMLVCGLIMLVLPKDKLYNPKKLKTQDEINKVIKESRRAGIIAIIVGLLFLFVL